MLPLSANQDYKNFDNANITNPFYDINGDFSEKIDIYGTEALDQAIENLICTEPYERLFNPDFWSPLYTILFENGVNIDEKMQAVYNKIEMYVPVMIDRGETDVKFNEYEHTLSLKIPYYYTIHGEPRYHTFNRLISR